MGGTRTPTPGAVLDVTIIALLGGWVAMLLLGALHDLYAGAPPGYLTCAVMMLLLELMVRVRIIMGRRSNVT